MHSDQFMAAWLAVKKKAQLLLLLYNHGMFSVMMMHHMLTQSLYMALLKDWDTFSWRPANISYMHEIVCDDFVLLPLAHMQALSPSHHHERFSEPFSQGTYHLSKVQVHSVPAKTSDTRGITYVHFVWWLVHFQSKKLMAMIWHMENISSKDNAHCLS